MLQKQSKDGSVWDHMGGEELDIQLIYWTVRDLA
jgi:hypothetical protein